MSDDIQGDLTNKQRAFVDEYFLCNMNGAEAARRLGSKQPRLYAHRMITNDNIKAEIERRLKEKQLSADEVLARLGDMARSDIADFANIRKASDLQDDTHQGKTHVVKKFKTKVIIDALGRQVEQVELELYDAQAALINIGKYHKLFTDKIEVDDTGLTDEDRANRIAAILDRARARRDRQANSGD